MAVEMDVQEFWISIGKKVLSDDFSGYPLKYFSHKFFYITMCSDEY